MNLEKETKLYCLQLSTVETTCYLQPVYLECKKNLKCEQDSNEFVSEVVGESTYKCRGDIYRSETLEEGSSG